MKIKVVSKDERLAQSEAFYGFLCPSPDYYKNQIEKTSIVIDDKFSIGSIFRSSKQNKETQEDELIDQLFADNHEQSIESNAKDSTAESFYIFLEELFELKGMKKWFRKSLIMFVQLTYGATINKKIRETVCMLPHYLSQQDKQGCPLPNQLLFTNIFPKISNSSISLNMETS